MTDWAAWHRDYDDASSSLSRRLAVVRTRLLEVLSGDAPPRSVLSLCAGDGRDVLPVLAGLPERRRPEVVLVELDPTLAAAAEQSAEDLGVVATVVVGDAGLRDTWQSAAPVDLLLLCGIFGNISEDDIRTTVRAAPTLLRPGGRVIWTRGWFAGQDLRPQIRQWFTAEGMEELAFDAEPEGYGVGLNRSAAAGRADEAPGRLFSFVR